jgi:hypothetical protein
MEIRGVRTEYIYGWYDDQEVTTKRNQDDEEFLHQGQATNQSSHFS